MTPLKRTRRSDARDLSQADVATTIGINTGYYSRIEKGFAQPSAIVAQKIVAFFGAPLTEEQVLYPERFTIQEPA